MEVTRPLTQPNPHGDAKNELNGGAFFEGRGRGRVSRRRTEDKKKKKKKKKG